ncbi:MAG: DUF523 and DUF1722 domain-containing protein [Planctomycetota bacterium]|nr:DUF523 and DUF1722 domain-containing protein [Planctomycetota bacterium]
MPTAHSPQPIAHGPDPIRIAVSRCLLGDEVRYDAREQRDHFIADTLGSHCEWLPICPEVEIGLGVPRPKIQLERVSGGGGLRLVMPQDNRDLTAKMLAHARRCVRRLRKERVAGCLLKSRSPSCGLSRVKIFTQGERMRRVGVGFFAKTLKEMLPELPVEEDDRMHDPAVRDNWIERVFAYRRLQRLFVGECKTADLAAFHAAYRLTLMSHSRTAYGELGEILQESPSRSGTCVPAELAVKYRRHFMAALCRPATRAKNIAVLRRVLSVLEPSLDADTRRRLGGLIEDYRQGDDGVPLIVPRTLLAHYAGIFQIEELCRQVYLRPDSAELGLRNHA